MELRTQFCESYLENTLRADITLEERNARTANALNGTQTGELNVSSGSISGGKTKDFERRLEILRARYIGYGESRAMHTQSQILERKKKRKDKMETERAEREKDKQLVVLNPEEEVTITGSSSKKRRSELQLSTSITKVVKNEDHHETPSSPTPTSSPISTPHSSPMATSAINFPSFPSTTKDPVRDSRGGVDDPVLLPASNGSSAHLDKSKEGVDVKEGRDNVGTIRLMVELDFMTKKLEKKKSASTKHKQEVQKLKQDTEKMKETCKDAENKLGNLQEKYDQLKAKYDKAKELKRKYHELELQYEKLKTKEELFNQFKKADT